MTFTLDFRQIFGTNATQTATGLILDKREFPLTGTANNNGEQLLAAIIKKAKPFLSVEKFPASLDQNITIDDGINDRVYRTEDGIEVPYLRTQVLISFHKKDLDRSAGIFPDDY
jgi:hypothetical protein